MRRRLLIVFLLPLVLVVTVLGGAFAWSAARGVQQEFYAEQLGDLSYFVTSARQALLSGSSEVFDGEAERYRTLYGTSIVIVDRAGRPWAPRDERPVLEADEVAARIALALSGRRGELPQDVMPWQFGDLSLVEPVYDGGDVIGAVVMSASVDVPRAEIARLWLLTAAVVVAVIAAGLFIVSRLAGWVLRPLRRLDRAMEAIERGDMDARIADETGPEELHRMILMFNRMADEIERVVARQQEFALNASHELRNPLNALLLRVEVLAADLGDTGAADVEKIREEGQRMTRILDTLLGFARRGVQQSAFVDVDLSALVRRRADAWQDVASRRGVVFRVTGGTGVHSRTDEAIVESALDAVIDNAVKFSPRGGRIDVSVGITDEGCRIAVRDHGPGLEPDELEQATDRFWRSARDQNSPGSGLGLAIATDLLRSVGGRVGVDRAQGGGLQVSFALPGAGERP
ncbi:HAMP domain-containing histidine kinase [Microbacterium esteraromaticum]|uniref:histidine kinase n=1 Tax=Microbacterium esteraromaticum TaxID=57043 RepID=A0A7D8A978_9MICO|nr:HAMP domain-containing sensor histidine kinase [Microbacterium esteraromaticum]QMU95784.1 HAMP domain-containing histidine kinase [Microbacterium esteraromaticum]